jgi:hypothetical protein
MFDLLGQWIARRSPVLILVWILAIVGAATWAWRTGEMPPGETGSFLPADSDYNRAVALAGEAFPKLPSRSYIALIVGDDIGFGDLGISGSVTGTPNLDPLAKQGTFFTNFHVSPVCSVSRSMLLTGCDPIGVGLAAFDYALYPPAEGKPGHEAYLKRNTVTVTEILQDAGYRTYTLGKWHLYDIKKDPGETRLLEADQPLRLRKMIDIYERYAKEKGIVPVADDWNPWRSL